MREGQGDLLYKGQERFLPECSVGGREQEWNANGVVFHPGKVSKIIEKEYREKHSGMKFNRSG